MIEHDKLFFILFVACLSSKILEQVIFLYIILLIVIILSGFWIRSKRKSSALSGPSRPKQWAQIRNSKHLKNFYEINENIFRSRQPSTKGMKELEEMGFKSVINLRHIKKDDEKASNTKLQLFHISINTWTLSQKELKKAVQQIKDAPKPTLVHCLHGSDRTGAAIAAYRVLELGWNKEDAIKELKYGGYGYHQFYFPHILWLIRSLKP